MRKTIFTTGLILACGIIMNFTACDPAGNGEAEGVDTGPADTRVDEGKGVGEVKNVELAQTLDEGMIEEGREIFNIKCAACHQLSDQNVVGPGLEGVTNRRKPEWIMNMINNPELMIREDPVAKELLAEYKSPMANQDVSVDQARSILEFFRFNDEQRIGSRDEGAD